MRKIHTRRQETQAHKDFVKFNQEKIDSFSVLLRQVREDPIELLDKLKILQDLADHFISSKNLELISGCTSKEKELVYQIFRNIIYAYGEIFFNFYNSIFEDEHNHEKLAGHICYYCESFLPKIKAFPLGLKYTNQSLATVFQYFDAFKENISYEDVKKLLEASKMLFEYITAQSEALENQKNPEQDRVNYSILLSFYISIHEKHPEDISLSYIIKFLNTSKKIQLIEEYYLETIRVISYTKKPSFSIIYYCFKKLRRDSSISFSLLSVYFKQALQNINVCLSDYPEGKLDDRSLNDLIKMFNCITAYMDTESYLLFIELLAAHKSLLKSDDLKEIYEYAENYMLLTESDADIMYSNKFIYNILVLMSKIEVPKLDKLIVMIDFWERACNLNTDENFLQQFYRRLFLILLKRQSYPTEEFAFLLDKVIVKLFLKDEEIYQLILNIEELHKNLIDDQLIKICNKYKETIRENRPLLILLISQFDRKFLEKIDDREFLLTQQEHYTELEALKNLCRDQIEDLEKVSSFNKILARCHNLLDCIEHEVDFAEASSAIRDLTDQLGKLYTVKKEANNYGIRINRYINAFLNTLKESELSITDITNLGNMVLECQNGIREEIESIKTEEVIELNLDEAKDMLNHGRFEDLIKVSKWLREPSNNQILLFMKTECLIKLGYYEEAMFWLEENSTYFPTQNKEKAAVLWARCCIALGCYQTALDIYKDLKIKSEKIDYDIALAYCHRMIGTTYDYMAALKIYDSLELRITEKLSATHPMSKENDNLIKQKNRVEREKIRCILSANLMNAAENRIESLDYDDPENLVLLARLYHKKFDFLKACESYESAIQKKFKFCWLKFLLDCYSKHKEIFFEKKDFFYDLLEQHKEDSVNYFEVKVLFLIQMERYVEALDLIEKLRETWGISQFIVLNRVMIYTKLGEIEKAIASLSSFPDYRKNKYFLKQLGLLYVKSYNLEKAIDCFDYLLGEYPTFISFYDKAIYCFIAYNDKKRVSIYWEQYQAIESKYSPHKNDKLEKRVIAYLNQVDNHHFETSVVESALLLQEIDHESEIEAPFINPKNLDFPLEQDDLLGDPHIDSDLRLSTISLFSVKSKHDTYEKMSVKEDASEEVADQTLRPLR